MKLEEKIIDDVEARVLAGEISLKEAGQILASDKGIKEFQGNKEAAIEFLFVAMGGSDMVVVIDGQKWFDQNGQLTAMDASGLPDPRKKRRLHEA